ncbi:unnamed protein product, partial [Ixodes persulcatus]
LEQALLISLLGLSVAQDHNDDSGVYAPYPYSFGYDTTDESGTRLTQSETGDEDNVKRGSYSYSDANGLYRVVNYIADKDGFRVTIDTNEPGTKTSSPADVQINSQAPPQPYHFNYDTTDEYGTRMTREETSDANNAKVGSYSYTDASGVTRTVKYVADENGFRATIETNEPGTKSHVTGDAEYISNAPDYVAPANPAPPRPVVVHAVQAAPVVHAVQAA